MPPDERVQLPFAVHHVLYRHPHHAGASGYDRLCDFVGEELQVSRALYYAGETLLRPVALFDARFGGHFEYSRYDWVLERALMSAMRRERGAIFHVLYGEKNFRHAWKVAGINGNQLVATLHHPPEHFDWLFKSTQHLSFLSHVIVMSEALRAFAEDLVGRGRVSVVPYGVDVNYFRPIAERGRTSPQLIFAGFHERDYEVLSQVVEIVVRSHDSAEFLMVSNDSRCEEIARRFPSRARRVAHLADDDYRTALQTSDLMVLPLKRSVACTAVLEALACGVPVLTTAGGIGDYVTPEAGVLCEVGDSDGMAEAALNLLRDECRLQQMQADAHQRALTFAWPLIARRTADVYQSVMCQ